MTRFITAGAIHVSEALLDPESRGWMPFWLKHLLSHPFHLHIHFKSSTCVYLCPPQNYSGTTPKLLISDAVAASSHFSPCLPHSSAPPRGLVLLLTGVICASGIDVVCWPIKIFEGNVYFLERIAPAAWKPFWIRPFMRKNLPLWGIVQDRSVTECWFGPLQRKWRSSRGSTDLTHAEPSVAIGEQPSVNPPLCFWHPSKSSNCHYRRLGVYYIAVSQQRRAES